MAIPSLDFLGYPPAKPAKAAKEGPTFSRISSFSRGVGPDSHSSPPPDRPIRDDHAAWLLTLPEPERRDWWRAVALRYARCEDWARAEAETRVLWQKPPDSPAGRCQSTPDLQP